MVAEKFHKRNVRRKSRDSKHERDSITILILNMVEESQVIQRSLESRDVSYKNTCMCHDIYHNAINGSMTPVVLHSRESL